MLHSSGLRSEYPYAVTTVQKWFLSAACNVAIFILLEKNVEVSPSIPPTAAICDIINCCSVDQCLGEGGWGRKGASLIVPALYIFALKEDPPLPTWRIATILEWPFGTWHQGGLGARGRQVWDGGCPQRSSDSSPRVSVLPASKGDTINQPIWGAVFCLTIHLSPWSPLGKMGQEGLQGRGYMGFTYLGKCRSSYREAGQGSLPTQWTSNLAGRRQCEKNNQRKGHTKSQEQVVDWNTAYVPCIRC